MPRGRKKAITKIEEEETITVDSETAEEQNQETLDKMEKAAEENVIDEREDRDFVEEIKEEEEEKKDEVVVEEIKEEETITEPVSDEPEPPVIEEKPKEEPQGWYGGHTLDNNPKGFIQHPDLRK